MGELLKIKNYRVRKLEIEKQIVILQLEMYSRIFKKLQLTYLKNWMTRSYSEGKQIKCKQYNKKCEMRKD